MTSYYVKRKKKKMLCYNTLISILSKIICLFNKIFKSQGGNFMSDFLDGMLVKFNKQVNKLGESSKLIMERAQVNTQINELEQKKYNLIQQLGTLAYNLQVQNEISVENFQEICDEIIGYEKQIEECNMNLKNMERREKGATEMNNIAMEDGIRCADCGFVNRTESKFCAKCGNKLQ